MLHNTMVLSTGKIFVLHNTLGGYVTQHSGTVYWEYMLHSTVVLSIGKITYVTQHNGTVYWEDMLHNTVGRYCDVLVGTRH
jgi:hypothetical protein